jgi:hypothetical protein
MSGLFQRLAVQAMGQAPLVHSTARLPFAPAPALVVETEAHETTASRPAPPASDETGPRAAIPALTTSAGVASSPAPPEPLLPEPERPARREAGEVEAEAPPSPPAAPARSARRTAPEPLLEPARGPERAGAPEPPRSRSRRMREDAEGPPAAEPAPVASAARPEGDRPRRAAPALLPLRPNRERPRGTIAPPASAPGDASERTADETSDIHVSIGRIEITAVHEAPAPKRRAARTGPALTLEEYLGRRRGARP